MKEGDLLFVYGTLRPSDRLTTMMGNSEYIGEDAITGDIYNLGWFPGVRLGGEHTVYGDVFKLNDASVIRALDSYEGYPSLYDRSIVDTQRGLRAWVYTINRQPGENERIESGDWLNQNEIERIN